jgi:hypothetical protein
MLPALDTELLLSKNISSSGNTEKKSDMDVKDGKKHKTNCFMLTLYLIELSAALHREHRNREDIYFI